MEESTDEPHDPDRFRSFGWERFSRFGLGLDGDLVSFFLSGSFEVWFVVSDWDGSFSCL